MKRLSVALYAVLMLFAALAHADNTQSDSPDQMVRKVADELMASIRADRSKYAKDHAKLYKMAEEKVLPHFDFVRMSQWVLGLNWRKATPEQRGRFVAQFRDLLVRTYSTALLNYTDQEIIYRPLNVKPADDDVLVRTEIRQSGGAPNIPINYSFYKNKEGAWKVYDVTIDGVSLVTNYRSVYADKVKSQGMEGLLSSMQESAKELRK